MAWDLVGGVECGRVCAMREGYELLWPEDRLWWMTFPKVATSTSHFLQDPWTYDLAKRWSLFPLPFGSGQLLWIKRGRWCCVMSKARSWSVFVLFPFFLGLFLLGTQPPCCKEAQWATWRESKHKEPQLWAPQDVKSRHSGHFNHHEALNTLWSTMIPQPTHRATRNNQPQPLHLQWFLTQGQITETRLDRNNGYMSVAVPYIQLSCLFKDFQKKKLRKKCFEFKSLI